jgi:hypothetical protein
LALVLLASLGARPAVAEATAVLDFKVEGQSFPVPPSNTGLFDNGSFYVPGLAYEVTTTITRTGDGELTDFVYTTTFPEGWTFTQGAISLPLKQTEPAGTTTKTYQWGSYSESIEDTPLVIKYRLIVPITARANFQVTGEMNFLADGQAQTSGKIVRDLSPDPDFDNDGMPNSFEDTFGLDSLNPDDAGGNLDNDGLSNLEEFLRRTDPTDPNSPAIVRFVAPGGSTSVGGGTTPVDPWDLAFALSQFPNTGPEPIRATLILLPGTYTGEFTLTPFIKLLGQSCAPEDDLGSCSIIAGSLLGAEGAEVKRLVFLAPDAATEQLVVNNVGMFVESCAFIGPETGGGTGVVLEGVNSGRVDIGKSTFQRLSIGVDVGGPIPRLWRSFFANLVAPEDDDDDDKQETVVTGVLIDTLPEGFPTGGNLGDSTDPSLGYNTFLVSSIEGGKAIINRRAEPLVIENNDWGTDNLEEIQAAIDGDADVEPFLAAGTAIFAASLFCTVWDGEDETRIENATLLLQPSTFQQVTNNVDGVYGFPAIGPGSYSLTTSATGYATRTISVDVVDGDFKSIVVPMFESDVVPEPTPGCCTRPDDEKVTSLTQYRGDLFVGGLMVAVLLAAGRRTRKRQN